MKRTVLLLFVFLLSILTLQLSAQKECKVLVPELDSIYIGKCKKGLAHGKGEAYGVDTYKGKFSQGLPKGQGIYTWANGDLYNGKWRNGKREGEGTLTLKLDTKDSIISGLWKDDKYLGPKPTPPRVISKTSIDRYSIRLTDGTRKRVLIDFLQNGARNTGITHLIMPSTKGVETSLGHSLGYE
ncbi:MAG: hypothetical protein GQ527_08220, partial [Bacteroidales bacterium]|nr:hypothetical protein [Bacteroidales bacterium]